MAFNIPASQRDPCSATHFAEVSGVEPTGSLAARGKQMAAATATQNTPPGVAEFARQYTRHARDRLHSCLCTDGCMLV